MQTTASSAHQNTSSSKVASAEAKPSVLPEVTAQHNSSLGTSSLSRQERADRRAAREAAHRDDYWAEDSSMVSAAIESCFCGARYFETWPCALCSFSPFCMVLTFLCMFYLCQAPSGETSSEDLLDSKRGKLFGNHNSSNSSSSSGRAPSKPPLPAQTAEDIEVGYGPTIQYLSFCSICSPNINISPYSLTSVLSYCFAFTI